jgi:putative colanic acid biosynthesis UDP-glucose lipid carrier transferase
MIDSKQRSQGMIRSYQPVLSFVRKGLDAVLVVFGLAICMWLYNMDWQQRDGLAAALALVFFYFTAELTGLYRSWRGGTLPQEAFRVFVAWGAVVAAELMVASATKTTANYSRLMIGTWFVITPCLLAGSRIVVRQALGWIRSRGYNSRTVAIVGAGELAQWLGRRIAGSPWMGFRLIGFYADESRGGNDDTHSTAGLIGGVEDVVDLARQNGVDVIYIALPMREEERIRRLLADLADTTASAYFVPDFFTDSLLRARWVTLGEIQTISIFETPFDGFDGWIKRLEDLVLGGVILALVAVPMVLIALGVKLSSAGPVFFRQRRYGADGREIRVWKFRTMTVCEDGDRILQASRRDSRVTKFGAFLRQTSLDELPQLFNVLKGEMSVVGPRPHAVAHNEEYRKLIPGYMLRHRVKPGLTGWAQVNGWRGQTDCLEKMARRVEHDLSYIRNWSLWLDLKILLLTLIHGFRGENTY